MSSAIKGGQSWGFIQNLTGRGILFSQNTVGGGVWKLGKSQCAPEFVS